MKQTKHFKRRWSLMLLLIAMLMPQGAWAISGNGTESSPYLIANEADLRTFQQYVENGNSGIYGKLTADITLTSAWTRIGRADRRFTGYFDGQGHTISDMNLSFTADEHGFFGFVNNATIMNFTLTGRMTSSANGNHSHGTVVGSAAGTTVIKNVTSSVNLTLNHTGFTCIGGIVGHMADNTRVTGCTYTGTINLTKDSEQVGGIVGYAQNDLYITDNVFSGTITSTGTCKYLAGIAGKTEGTIEVSGCTNIGTINGGPSYDCVAGIVGYVHYQSQALITNCYFGGSLSSTSSDTSLGMGGILGAVNDDAGTNFRGLTYCFSDGTLTATNSSSTQIGGIAGVIKSKAVSKVLNNSYLSGTASRLAAISNNSSTFDSSNKAITISVTAGTGGEVSQSYVYPTSTTATQLQVVATPNSGYHYVKWSDNGAQTHNVSLANNVSLTATFGAHTYGDWTTDVAATCTSAGTKHRVCTHTGCGAREDGTIAALGHGSTGYTPTYTWGGTYDAATCTFTLKCGSCGGEVFNDNITTTKVDANHVDVTCGKDGNERWTATGSYSKAGDATYNGEAQVKDYAIPATGLHTFADDDLAQGHCTVCNHGFFRYTAEEKVEPHTPENLKDAEGQGIYDKEKHTFDGKNGVMEFDKPLVTIGEKAFFQCYQFKGDLIIPNTVTTIENYGFNGCSGFTGIEMNSVPQIGTDAFNSVNCTKAVVLSDDSYVYTRENPNFPEVQSATYTRRGIKNQFGTLVLPFDVNGMGADYDLYKLDQVTEHELVLRKVDEDDNRGIVPAGTPVVFRLHNGLAGNHTLTLTASNTTVSGQLEERSEDNDSQLVGTYETIELYDYYDYFISNNMFFRANDAGEWGVKVAPFRAYLSHNPWSSAKAQTLSIRIADEDDDVTAVETLNAITDGTAEYYDMNGRRINSLQKGVNIVKYGNGKTLKVNIK